MLCLLKKEPGDDLVRDRIDGAPTGDWDEDGFHLRLSTDEGEYDLRVTDPEVARALLAAVEPLRDWVAEADHHRAAYDRATPEERDAVLHHRTFPIDRALAIHMEVDEALREAADLRRKSDRENA